MKKLLWILLGALLLCTGCTPKQRPELNFLFPVYDGTSWGMTAEETFEVLATAAEDWEETPSASNESLGYRCESLTAYGESVSVLLTFQTKPSIGLISVTLTCKSADSFAVIREQLIDQYGETNGYQSDREQWEGPTVEEAFGEALWAKGKPMEWYVEQLKGSEYQEQLHLKGQEHPMETHGDEPFSEITDLGYGFYFDGFYAALWEATVDGSTSKSS